MPAASSPRAAGALLSIGQVLARLGSEFEGLQASKLRFLEVQGIVTPTRTPSGYRKFSNADVERLRLALQLQRDHYLPLGVIREYLDELDEGRQPSLPASPPVSIHPTGRRFRRDELGPAAGAGAQLINDAISTGLLPAADSYDDRVLALLTALAALEARGIEPRHLRGIRQAAERDVSLIETAIAPLMRKQDPAARARAAEIAPELARRIEDVRQAVVRQALSRSEFGRLLP